MCMNMHRDIWACIYAVVFVGMCMEISIDVHNC